MTLTIPNEWIVPLADQARRQGTTPELLALEAVRRIVGNGATVSEGGSLLDTLAGHIGVVSGTGEPFSQDCGRKLAEGLAAEAARP